MGNALQFNIISYIEVAPNLPLMKLKKKNQSENPKGSSGKYMGLGVALGTGIGAAVGVAMDNIAIGLAVGISIGAAVGAALEKRHANK